MPSTTASEDELLLDAIEREVRDHDLTVKFERCWINAGRPDNWQVSYHLEAKRRANQSGKDIAMSTGGGVTLREALQNSLCNLTIKRLDR